MKKNYIIPILLGITGVALVYSYLKKNKGEKPEAKPFKIDVPEPEKIGEVDFNVGTDKFPMGKGARGYNVERKPDGIFGSETEKVLEEQTGKKTVSTLQDVEKIASKNGLVKSFTKEGYTFIPKSKQNILAQIPKKPF
jgi:hypothetical protein